MNEQQVKRQTDGELYRMFYEHSDLIYDYLRRNIPSRYSAVLGPEDVLQEVWVSAVEGARASDAGEIQNVKRWLLTIAQNKLLDMLKALKRLKRSSSGGTELPLQISPGRWDSQSAVDWATGVAVGGSTPSREVAAQEVNRRVQIVMATLPKDQRTALMMRYIEGRSVQEITTALGRTLGAVNGLLFRGLRVLRKRLGEAEKYFSDSRVLIESRRENRGMRRDT